MKKISFLITMMCSTTVLYADGFDSNIPQPSDAPLYYQVGGGNMVPKPPSLRNTVSIGFDGYGALGYTCDQFNPNTSIGNALNGAKNSMMNAYNSFVNSASGVIITMPAYIFSKANPALYQLMQNGLFSGQFDLDLGLKSCYQMMDDVNSGNSPYQGLSDISTRTNWKAFQYGSNPRTSADELTYLQSSTSDVSSAAAGVAADNGASGIEWTHGRTIQGSKRAGGYNQDAILLTNDTVLAGISALLGRSDYHSNTAIPSDDTLHDFFKTPSEASQWAVKVLSEQKVYTDGRMPSSSTPGTGLLPMVSKEKQIVYENLVNLVSGNKPINIENLKSVSTNRLMIEEDKIRQLQNETDSKRAIETKALAEGVAALRVIDEAEILIQIFNAARQVPSISVNDPAQEAIDKNIQILNKQIEMVMAYKKRADELVISTLTTMNQSKQIYIREGNRTAPGAIQNPAVIEGFVSTN